jgi:hypothetical protein
MDSLRFLIRANAASCFLFGGLFLAAPTSTANFLGDPPAPAWLIGLIGLGLVVNAAHLVGASRRRALWPAEILYFSAGDLAWVLATIGLLLAELWITTPAGWIASLLVAALVGGFGTGQMLGLGRHRQAVPAAQG